MCEIVALFEPLARAWLENETGTSNPMTVKRAGDSAVTFSMRHAKPVYSYWDDEHHKYVDHVDYIIELTVTNTTMTSHRKCLTDDFDAAWILRSAQTYSLKGRNSQGTPVLHRYEMKENGATLRFEEDTHKLLRVGEYVSSETHDILQALSSIQSLDRSHSESSTALEMAYPMLRTFKPNYALTGHLKPMLQNHPALRLEVTQENAREVLASIVGKQNARRDMVRVLKETPGAVAVLPYAKLLLDFMPVEYVIEIMRAVNPDDKDGLLTSALHAVTRSLVGRASPIRLKQAIIRGVNDENCNTLLKGIDRAQKTLMEGGMTIDGMPVFLNADQYNSELGKLVLAHNDKQAEIAFPRTEAMSAIDGFMYWSATRKLTVVVPKNGIELRNWAQTMRNCISIYGDDMRATATLVFAVMDGDEMLYNAEVKYGSFVACMAKWNQPAPEAEVEALKGVLVTAGVLLAHSED